MFRPLFSVLFLLVLAAPAEAAARIALVIGIAGYQHVSPLRNTVNDATAVTRELTTLGFEVRMLTEPKAADIEAALKDFAFRAEVADIALLYYAGHGIEVNGRNYILPVDANISDIAQAPAQLIAMDRLLAATASARQLRMVILDSCRNNPFEGVAGVSSFAPSTSSDGPDAAGTSGRSTLVVYSAKDGATALDGDGTNSPFALALLDNIKQPGLEIGMLFRQVRDQVLTATGNRQEPYTYGSISGAPVFLAGDAGASFADKRQAWSALKPDAESQLVALADQGDTRSLIGLAYIRQNPDGGRYDPAQALNYLKKAADAGDPEAEFELGKAFEQGIGTPQDPKAAMSWFQKAAAQGFADAINDIGYIYVQGGDGVPRDRDLGISYFLRAADLGHPQAMFNAAAMIDDGLVAGKTSQDAATYLYRAIRAGSQDVLDQLSEKPTMFKDPTRRALQQILKENGFYDSGVDGQIGNGTRRGLRRAYGIAE